MPDCIHEDRMVAAKGVPVWHTKGDHGITEPMSGANAYSRIGKDILIEVVKIQPVLEDGTPVPDVIQDRRVILRYPTSTDPESPHHKFVSFGIVGPEYKLVTHDLAARLWDEHVGQPVHTAGILHNGAAMFMSCPLSSFDIRGEETRNHLVHVNWAREGVASLMMKTSIQPVCDNTVQWGEQVAVEKLRLVHDRNIVERTAAWLEGAMYRAENDLKLLHEYGNLLAHTDVSNERVVETLSAAYPMPNEPQRDCPPEEFIKKFEKYELDQEKVKRLRLDTYDLFDGKGIGMELPSRRGTMWGLVSAVAEEMTYRPGRMVGQSVLVGERGAAVGRAVTKAVELCHN